MAQKEKKEKMNRITLKGLIDQNLPIWVRNNTHQISKRGVSGVISVEIKNGNDKQTIRVPAGTDPFCLSDQADANSLRNCMDLFKLTKQPNPVLELLDPNYVEEYYTQNERRWEAMKRKTNELEMASRPDFIREMEEQEEEPVNVKRDIVKPSVMNLVLKLNGDKASENDAMEFLYDSMGTLTVEDLNYLLDACGSNMPNLVKMVEEELRKLKNKK